MLRNGVGKIDRFALISITVVVYFVVVVTAEQTDINEQKDKQYIYNENEDSSRTFNSNFETRSRKRFQTESERGSDLSHWKLNGKGRNKSDFPTKEVILNHNKVSSKTKKNGYNGGDTWPSFTSLYSDLEASRDKDYRNDDDGADSNSKHDDLNQRYQSDFYSEEEGFQRYNKNKDERNQKSVGDLYSDSELSGEFEQNVEVESSSSDGIANKKRATKSSLFTPKKAAKSLQGKDDKTLLKKSKKICTHGQDGGNLTQTTKPLVKVKEQVNPTVTVKHQSNIEKPVLANYNNTGCDQNVQSHYNHNNDRGQDKIPAAIDMAFGRPSSSVTSQSRPSEPYSRPTQVQSRMAQPPTTSTQTYTKPTQIKPSNTFTSSKQLVKRPIEAYTRPTNTFTKPKLYTKPKKSYSRPTKTVIQPSKIYSKIKKSYKGPTKTLAKPSKIYAKPKDSYTRPTQIATKLMQSQVYTKPKQNATRPFPQPTHWLNRHWSQQALAKPTKIQSCKSAIDLAFLMEGSRSVSQTGFDNFLFLRDFVKKISSRMVVSPKQIRIGLITFALKPYLHLGLNGGSKIAAILEVLNRPPPRYHRESSARTGRALDFVRRQLFGCYCRPESTRKKVIVLITDGSSIDRVYWPARRLKDADVQIVCVGIGRYFNINQLNTIASRPYTKNVFTGAFTQIHHVINELVKQICNATHGTLVPSRHSCPCE